MSLLELGSNSPLFVDVAALPAAVTALPAAVAALSAAVAALPRFSQPRQLQNKTDDVGASPDIEQRLCGHAVSGDERGNRLVSPELPEPYFLD